MVTAFGLIAKKGETLQLQKLTDFSLDREHGTSAGAHIKPVSHRPSSCRCFFLRLRVASG